MVYLYRSCVDSLFATDSRLERLCGIITPARLERAGRTRDITAKRTCLAVELLLCLHMQKVGFKISDFPLNIVADKSGKPRFDTLCGDMPYFSFSHSHNMALCGVTDHEIGVDIEKLRDMDAKKRLFEKIHSGGDNTPSLIHAWSAKEAYLKLTGEGLTGEFKLSDIQVCENTVLNTSRKDTAYLFQFEDAGFVISVCTREKCEVKYEAVEKWEWGIVNSE